MTTLLTTAHWSFGVIIGAPLVILTLAALALTGVLLARKAREMDGDIDAPTVVGLGWAARIVALLFAVGMFFGFWPYKAEYHQWRPVDGKVQQIGSRILTADESVSQRYVFVINGQPYGVDDTRASLVKVGDTVHLSCKRGWQWFSVPGYVCRWNG